MLSVRVSISFSRRVSHFGNPVINRERWTNQAVCLVQETCRRQKLEAHVYIPSFMRVVYLLQVVNVFFYRNIRLFCHPILCVLLVPLVLVLRHLKYSAHSMSNINQFSVVSLTNCQRNNKNDETSKTSLYIYFFLIHGVLFQ